MYLTIKDYYLEICKNLAHSKRIWIATYNTYPGITQFGLDIREAYKETNGTAEILDALENIKETNIMCGVPPLIYCKDGGCEDCARKWKNLIKRYKATVQHWDKVNWRFCKDFHLKYFVIEYEDKDPVAFVGSRNFSDSSWSEIMVKLPADQSKAVLKVAGVIWNMTPPVSLDDLINEK